jgi:YNFM family putative membrane transporter
MSSRYSSGVFDNSFKLNLAVLAAGIATFVNMYCTMSILPLFAGTFGVSHARAGLTITVPLLATAMVAPVVGAISDRFGRRRLILGAACLLVVPTALAAFSADFNNLLLWRLSQGLILPFIFTVTIAYIGDEASGPATAKLSATYMSGAIFGGFAGRALAGIGAQAFGWRAALLIIAGVTLLAAVVIGICLPPEKKFRPVYGIKRALGSFPLHLGNKRLLATFGVGFGVLFCMIGVFTYINFRLAAAPYHLGPAALGGIFVVYLAAVVATPMGARAANRFGRRRVTIVAACIATAGLLCTLASPLPVIIMGLALLCCGIFVQQTLATAFIGIAAGQAKSAAVGLYVTCYYIGGAIGGILPAPFYHLLGWPGCVALVLTVQGLMVFLALKFWVTSGTSTAGRPVASQSPPPA